MLPDEVTATLTELGAPAFRARQLFAWVHKRHVESFAAMSDLPAELRHTLETHFTLTVPRLVEHVAAPDGTTKFLFALADGHTVETVAIPDSARVTVCVSTQVGCAFGCVFCATGQSGFTRNLSAAEIVGQVYRVHASLPAGQQVTNVVYMGMGEPLANYEEVLRSVRLLIHPLGMNLAQRRITISTVGLTPGIERLSTEGLQVNLAISLHAPTQEGRIALLPIAKQYPLDGVMTAARQYVRRSGRKISFEYTVVPGVNDSPQHAEAIARLVRGFQAMVNVIPLNPSDGLPVGLRLTSAEFTPRAARFADLLTAYHVEAALRRSRGQEVGGACGQLRRRAIDGEAKRKGQR